MAPIFQGLRSTFPRNLSPGTIRKEFSLGRQAEHKSQARKYTRLCFCLKRHSEAQPRCHCGDWNKYRILLMFPGWTEQKVLPLTIMTTDPSSCLSCCCWCHKQEQMLRDSGYNLPVFNLHFLCTLSSRYILYLML